MDVGNLIVRQSWEKIPQTRPRRSGLGIWLIFCLLKTRRRFYAKRPLGRLRIKESRPIDISAVRLSYFLMFYFNIFNYTFRAIVILFYWLSMYTFKHKFLFSEIDLSSFWRLFDQIDVLNGEICLLALEILWYISRERGHSLDLF